MTTLNTTLRSVPKIYRNKRIYHGSAPAGPVVLGSADSGSSSPYTAGDGVDITGSVISLDTNYIQVTAGAGVKLKYDNVTILEIMDGYIQTSGLLSVNGGIELIRDDQAAFIDADHDPQIYTTSQDFEGWSGASELGHLVIQPRTSANRDVIIAGSTDGVNTEMYMRIGGGQVGIGMAGTSLLTLKSSAVDTTGGIRLVENGGSDNIVYIYEGVAGGGFILLRHDATNKVLIRPDSTSYFTNKVQFDWMDSKSETYVSGFDGSGWKLNYDSGYYSLEVDKLKVRRSMSIYELIVNQIRATNGSLWVTDSVKVASVTLVSGDIYDIGIDDDGGNIAVPFAANDQILGQSWDGRDVKTVEGEVVSVSSDEFRINLDSGSDIPAVGDTLVRIGNDTDSDRQGSIYITSSDSDAPYIDILDGVDSGTIDAGDIKARLGNLEGITDADFGGALSGYGLYSTNIYLKGEIIASGGEIGGWTIDTDAIYTGSKHTGNDYSTTGISLVDDGSIHTPNFYINDDGEVGIRAILVQAYTGVSDTVILSHDATTGTANFTPTLLKTITLGSYVKEGRTLRIKFDLQSGAAGYNAYGQIYRGATPVGTLQSTTSTSMTTKTEDIAGWDPGDEIRLYVYAQVGALTCNVRYFRVCGEIATITDEITGTNS